MCLEDVQSLHLVGNSYGRTSDRTRRGFMTAAEYAEVAPGELCLDDEISWANNGK